MDAKSYQQTVDQMAPKRPIFKNCMKAFLTGGIICSIGQVISFLYMYFFNFTERTASNPSVATIVFLSMVLTGFGIYKKIGQFGGAGSAVPVSGFGNAVISAAIEHKSEGFILGVGVNMFKLAGPVIVYGVFSAFVVALIKTILVKMGVISW